MGVLFTAFSCKPPGLLNIKRHYISCVLKNYYDMHGYKKSSVKSSNAVFIFTLLEQVKDL